MKYKVLYRKYRPNNFENIIGQDYTIKTLKNSIVNKNISHAYIFSGPRGTGKTSTAKVFSKAINCLNSIDGSPCEKCEFCINFHENPDIIEIDAASNNGVDEIRSLIDNIKLTPTNGNYKVYIIDEVHMLTTSAFNALLLTLEEPPSHAIFILATTNVENVPITILSRCQRFDFQKITVNTISNKLKEICEVENIEYENDAITEIAYLSEGGMRDALSLLDQLSKSNNTITLDLLENHVKTISQKSVNDLLNFVEKNDVNNFLNSINEYKIRAIDYKTFIKKLIDICSNKVKKIKKTGSFERLNFNDYKKLIINLSDLLTKININIDPFTMIELVILEFFDDIESKNEKTNEIIEDTSNDIKSESINETNFEKLINVRINNCFVNAKREFLGNNKQMFELIKNDVNIDGKIKSIITDCQVVAASDKNLIITCYNDHIANDSNKYIKAIETIILDTFQKNIKIIFISEEKWHIEKEKYIKNLKNNYKYEYIEEQNSLESDTIINDVFDISKVEVI